MEWACSELQQEWRTTSNFIAAHRQPARDRGNGSKADAWPMSAIGGKLPLALSETLSLDEVRIAALRGIKLARRLSPQSES